MKMYWYNYPVGRINLQYIFLIYLLPQLSVMINVARILQDYNAACGHLSCKHNNLNLLKDKGIYSSLNRICSPCSCEMSCVRSGNCCPDMYYSLGLACVQSSILKGPLLENYRPPDPILMIHDCPLNSNIEEKKLCNISNEQIIQMHNVPVTSKKTGLVYRNLECLKCNDEYASDAISWRLTIYCGVIRKSSHLNYLSSYAEILEKAQSMDCGIAYQDATGIKPNSRKCNYKPGMIHTCNISGTWQHYDPDIDAACRTYDKQYFFFKNIFCYICNPPTSNRNLISSCNVTGLWELYNGELETACLESKQSSVTGEFKNIYCYLCNTNNLAINNSYYAYLLDTVVDIKQEITYENKFNFNIQIKQFRLEYIIKSITEDKAWQHLFNISNRKDASKNKCASCTSDAEIEINTKSSHDQMLDIYTRYFAFTGYAHFCKNYSTFTHIDKCDCDDFCGVYKPPPTESRCCVDNPNLYRQMTACLDSKYSAFSWSYLVNIECNFSNNKALKELCYNNSTDYIFYSLPASLTTSKDNYTINFRNLFCASCEIEKETKHNEEIVLQLWDIRISCNVYMVIFYHSSLQSFIQFAKENNCFIYYDPNNTIDVLRCKTKSYNKCNMTGMWISYDPYVNWACEHFTMGSNEVNVFCEMCNPVSKLNISITTCNETFLNTFDNNLFENCNNMPAIQNHAPFKNIFCRRCNGVELENGTSVVNKCCPGNCEMDINEVITLPTLQMLFSVGNLQRPTEKPKTDGNCEPNQMFSKAEDRCLYVYCYPGRILVNDVCLPLLEITHGIGYVLSLELNGNASFYIDDMQSFLNSTEMQMRDFIRHNTYLCNLLRFEESIYFANVKCHNSVPLGEKGISVLVYQKLSCLNVNRTGLDEQLLLLTRLNVSIWYSGKLFQFSLKQNANAILLPSKVFKSELNNCFIERDVVFIDSERYSHVTELLVCKQIELKQNEFWIDNETLELNIISKEIKLSNLEYTITPTNKVQICADRYKSLFAFIQEKQSIFQYALGILLRISTCISLFCLLVTFLAYLLFPCLRTLPGKNNMCLIVSMISAHSLYQFGLFQTKLEYTCIVIAILIHYFWLATFLCLNVCSFHMFRVFRSMTNMINFHDNEKSNTILLFYSLYSYGIPFLIVSINVGVTVIVKKNSDVGYGGVVCFVNNPISLIVTFILPILLVCLSNIVFFVVTACRISTTAKDSKERLMESNKLHYSIYIKLFTLTGISWIFQIIDSFLPDSVGKNVFSAVTSLLNALQGVFIFVSYVCNKRVLQLLIMKVSTAKHHTTSTSNSRTTRL